MAAGSKQRSAWGIILPLQGLEEEGVITIDKANLPVFQRQACSDKTNPTQPSLSTNWSFT